MSAVFQKFLTWGANRTRQGFRRAECLSHPNHNSPTRSRVLPVSPRNIRLWLGSVRKAPATKLNLGANRVASWLFGQSLVFQLFDHGFRPDPNSVVVCDHSPRNLSILDDKDRRARDITSLNARPDVAYAVRVDHFSLGVRQDLEVQLRILNNASVLLWRVDAHSDYLSTQIPDLR